jgi:beta-galactosidase
MRTNENFNKAWLFHPGDKLSVEITAFGTQNLINDETRIWQKSGNHGISKPENPGTDAWRVLDVPHDYAVEGEFSRSVSYKHGSLPHGTAWYVKKFALPAGDRGKRICIEFDGVYRNSTVWFNGHYVGRYLSGYTSFGFDLTDYCRFGESNAIAVHVDATENELWSYEGAGIYRSVRLVKTAPLHIPRWGVYVTTGVEATPGRLRAEMVVSNDDYLPASGTIRSTVYDAAGVEAGKVGSADEDASSEAIGIVSFAVEPFESVTETIEIDVATPLLWTIESPTLYTLVTEVIVDDCVVDRYTQRFGFRYFSFDPGDGFFLNGESLKLQGVCCHQDSAGVGVAVPPALWRWRVERLKSIGCNAVRTSHNPPDPSFLDACDELGLLVMDEHRMSGSSIEMLGQLNDLILRDRNHPSVILWSIGNEEMGIQDDEVGVSVFRRMQHLTHRLDPSRPTTYAMNCDWIDICDRYADADLRFDVFGANYRSSQVSAHYDEFHAKYPDWPILGSETWGGVATRGLYEPDKVNSPLVITPQWRERDDTWRDDDHKYYASAYGGTRTPWGYSIEETWQDCASRPFLAGTFIWTGFDYRGETFPYEWPSVITRFGVIDLCGNPKEVAEYLRAWWKLDVPHIFLLPHWTWTGREGEDIDVWCYSNCHSVELFLNGTSLGKKGMPERFRLEWKVPYSAGEIKAVGFDESGAAVVDCNRITAGASAGLKLSASKAELIADGEDVVVVNVQVCDKNGNPCPLSDDTIDFSVEGPVHILGVGNGNPVSHEPDKAESRKAFHGLCQAIVQSTGDEGIARLTATGRRLKPVVVELPVSRKDG